MWSSIKYFFTWLMWLYGKKVVHYGDFSGSVKLCGCDDSEDFGELWSDNKNHITCEDCLEILKCKEEGK